MSVRIRIPRYLQDKTNGQALLQVEGSTVRECIEALIHRYPDLDGEILDGRGLLLLKWVIYINDKSANSSDELAPPVNDGDLITLVPLVAGG
jgi:molybdopterin converting factor small subunit